MGRSQVGKAPDSGSGSVGSSPAAPAILSRRFLPAVFALKKLCYSAALHIICLPQHKKWLRSPILHNDRLHVLCNHSLSLLFQSPFVNSGINDRILHELTWTSFSYSQLQ